MATGVRSQVDPGVGVDEAVEDVDPSNARCDTDVCIGTGSGEVRGAVVGGDVTIEQNSNFTCAPGLAGVEPSVDGSGMYPPPITYLHLAVIEVRVEPAGRGSAPGKRPGQ